MTLEDHDNTTQTITNYDTENQAAYAIDILDAESYILSLPNNLTNNITVDRGGTYSFDLPCKVDSFVPVLSACVVDTTIPAWATVD